VQRAAVCYTQAVRKWVIRGMAATTLLLPLTASAERDWYGWQPMLADGGAVVITASSAKLFDSPGPGMMAGLALYALGSPIIHASHDNWGRAGISFGARVALPVIGGGIGGFIASAGSDHSMGGNKRGLGGAMIGGTIGIVTALALDYIVLAVEDKTPQATPKMLLRLSGSF
jgi:hypothetical protein